MELLEPTGDGFLHAQLPELVSVLEWVAAGIDLLAIGVLLIGAVRFVVDLFQAERAGADRLHQLELARVELGRYILAGLELFIVTDIIKTALSLAMADLIFLGLLVGIRAVTSYFLTQEIREIREKGDK
ncbi:DUF1622 domain-containing protein [Rhodovulum sp. YNF3179]|uniref:DUF1622 domain-containing protein n=1 Tax=Rhodovulum sp. YNF3179 TaxID=3425127 RepID=UPI003D3543DE